MKTNYKLRKVDWNEIKKLSKKIIKQLEKSNIDVETLVTVFRGGSVLSLLLSSNMDNLETACIHITRSLSNESNADFGNSNYKGITNIPAIKGKNILITEDIVDSGLTLDKVVKVIKKFHPKNIYVATFYNFNKGKYKNIITGENIDEYCWIVFPWEEKINEKD